MGVLADALDRVQDLGPVGYVKEAVDLISTEDTMFPWTPIRFTLGRLLLIVAMFL
jgi:hypothetical protein